MRSFTQGKFKIEKLKGLKLCKCASRQLLHYFQNLVFQFLRSQSHISRRVIRVSGR